MNQYKAIILGCGKIAGGYDKPGEDVILTHAHAISRSPEMRLTGVYDINAQAARELANKWQTEAYGSIPEIFHKTKPDIVTVAVPDAFHEDLLETLQEYSPRIIICEKPLGKNLARLKRLLGNYRKRNIHIAVNFNRNYDQRIIRLKEEMQLGMYGEFLNGVFFYSKGLRHNGSHAISLLRYLFGEVSGFKILGIRNDYLDADPSIDVQLQFQSGAKCCLLAGHESKYSIFEWQFLFSKSRLIFKKDGFLLCRQDVIDDPLFPGYRTLGDEQCEETRLKNSMSRLYENVLRHLDSDEPLLCSAEDAFSTQTVIEKMFNHINVN